MNRFILSLLAIAIFTGTSGCSTMTSYWNRFFPKDNQAKATDCSTWGTNRFILLPLDASWVEGRIDCPSSGVSTVGYKADLQAPTLVTLRLEVLDGDGLITIRHADERGDIFGHLESSELRENTFGLAMTPGTTLYVSSPGNVRFRIRNQAPTRRTSAPRPIPVTRDETPRAEPATREPVAEREEPQVTVAVVQPAAPGTRLLELISRVGDPVRQIRLGGGEQQGVFAGQQGRISFDDGEPARFCIQEAYSGSSTARLHQPLPELSFTESNTQRIEVATRNERRLKLLRSSGNPVHELELRGGRRDCLSPGMPGRVVQGGETVGRFELGRVESSRAWAKLDQPLARDRTVGARYVLDLAPAAVGSASGAH